MEHVGRDKAERFLRHLKPLQGVLESYARKMSRRSIAADDALQEAVMKAYRDFDTYAEGSNFRAWIFKYLNLELLASNRRSRQRDHDVLPFEPLAPQDHVAIENIGVNALPGVEGVVLDQCDAELAAAFRALSDVERAVLLLRALASLSYRETAEALSMPVGTVMSHLFRGRKRIREMLQDRVATPRPPKQANPGLAGRQPLP